MTSRTEEGRLETSNRSRLLRRAAGAVVLGAMVACSTASSPGPEPVATTSSELAIAGLFATGVNAAGTPLAIGTTDPHYLLSSNDPAFPGPNALAVTPNVVWTGNTATSTWISIQASTTGANSGSYTYTTTFTLTGGDPTTATLSGTWAADDSVTLSLNGTQVAQYVAPAYGATATFNVAAGSPFHAGSNTLTFVTVNSGNGPTGLQVVTLTGTITGCTADAQCTTAQFCNTQTKLCTAKLANSTALPTITGHTPPLTGVCAALVGSSVCVSGVCDASDSECGYADGDGPCTVATGATLCQSGACSVSGVCEPAGGCEADGDCAAGNWCDESTTTCTPKLANGSPVPNDPPHTNPTLNGTCTAAAGALVCISGVCDTKDSECGYADGDGPCTTSSGATVCRSGSCSTSGVCEPAGGCVSDADCTGGDWCDESTSSCTPKLANGTSIPVDAPHINPTLNGKCTPAAATLVCVSGVCDTNDSECGYADGDGPCTTATAGTVCRSGACSTNGTCEPMGGCNAAGDCPGETCNTTTHLCQAVPDAGTPTDGGTGSDAGPPADAGSVPEGGPSPDAAVSPGVDSGPEGPDAGSGSYLDGGGLSCGVTTAGGGPVVPGVLAALGLLAAARRRRSR